MSSRMELAEHSLAAAALQDLPDTASEVISDFLHALSDTMGGALDSVLLFGSAAEGRLRPSSDLNLLVIADSLGEMQLDALRAPLKAGRAAAGLQVMFLEKAEFVDACEAFAMKFSDMKARHRLLYGADPFTATTIPRDAAIRRLRQVLLNLQLRLRERYAVDGDRNDGMARVLADLTGPIRVSAATLLALRDGRDRPPKAALQEFCKEPRWSSCLEGLSAVHGGAVLPPEGSRALVADVLALLAVLGAAVVALP